MADVEPNSDDFDDMHHALGRPKTSKGDTYRNYYCCPAGGMTAQRFEALGCWDFGRYINDRADAIYHVNGVGKQKLGEWMDRQSASAVNIHQRSDSDG